MKIEKGKQGVDLLESFLKKNQGALTIFKDFCDQYENATIHEYTIDRMYELLKPMLNDPLCVYEETTAKNIGNLAKKHLLKKRPPNRRKNSTEHYRKGMTIALHYLELREKGLGFEESVKAAGDVEFVGFESAKKYITEYKDKAVSHREYFKLINGKKG